MTSHSVVGPSSNLVEAAILAKCILEEAWTNCLRSIEHRCKMQYISQTERIILEDMYTSFFYDAYYAPVKTASHIDLLLLNTRKMLEMLKAMDEMAWRNVISLNNQSAEK